MVAKSCVAGDEPILVLALFLSHRAPKNQLADPCGACSLVWQQVSRSLCLTLSHRLSVLPFRPRLGIQFVWCVSPLQLTLPVREFGLLCD